MQDALIKFVSSADMSGSDEGYCQPIDKDVQNIVDDYEQPTRHPGCCIRIEARFGAFRPGRAAGPGAIFDPDHVSRQMPAINDKVSPKYHGEGIRILSDKEKRQNIKSAMYERCRRALDFFLRHPFALQKVITNGVSDKLISCKHQHPLIETSGWIVGVTVPRQVTT